MRISLSTYIFFLLNPLSSVWGESESKGEDLLNHLTQSEKAYVRDSRMPLSKLEELFDAEISLDEYFQYPWLKAGITEKEWIRQRKAGLTQSDQISTRQITSKQWAVVQNFFFPGYHQFKRHQLTKGFLMSGLAAGSLALYALHQNPREKDNIGFDYPIYLLAFVADLLWSSIDIGAQINKEINKNASRFSLKYTPSNFSIQNFRTVCYVSNVSQ